MRVCEVRRADDAPAGTLQAQDTNLNKSTTVQTINTCGQDAGAEGGAEGGAEAGSEGGASSGDGGDAGAADANHD